MEVGGGGRGGGREGRDGPWGAAAAPSLSLLRAPSTPAARTGAEVRARCPGLAAWGTTRHLWQCVNDFSIGPLAAWGTTRHLCVPPVSQALGSVGMTLASAHWQHGAPHATFVSRQCHKPLAVWE